MMTRGILRYSSDNSIHTRKSCVQRFTHAIPTLQHRIVCYQQAPAFFLAPVLPYSNFCNMLHVPM